MTKHTKGEWTIRHMKAQDPHKNDPLCIYSGSGDPDNPYLYICRVDAVETEGHPSNNKANARLIAQSPNMLEALEIAQDLTDKWKRSEHGADFHEVDKVLRIAIRKARGE